jgi:hypothetical protein
MISRRIFTNCMMTVCLMGLLSCDNDVLFPTMPVAGDYFPLENGREWKYIRTHRYDCDCFDSGNVLTDTLDMFVDPGFDYLGNPYKIISEKRYLYSRYIGKKDNQYIEIPAYQFPYIFLVDNKPVNYTWRCEEEGYALFEFRVRQVNATMRVAETDYQNVIEIVEVISYADQETGRLTTSSKTHHYYAKGIGEIYSLQTFLAPTNRSTIEYKLINYVKK